ncbi:MAG: hypothetical protein PUP93_05290 [Rhizonema sp. NSF051]|nr:hypothetical protein [Rhizonema sp. NSF051]
MKRYKSRRFWGWRSLLGSSSLIPQYTRGIVILDFYQVFATALVWANMEIFVCGGEGTADGSSFTPLILIIIITYGIIYFLELPSKECMIL